MQGLRKGKGSQTFLWLISLHSGKSLLPTPSQSSPHMSHTGGYCYSVIWKSNSSLLSVPSPAVHKERTVQEWGRG